MPKTNRDVFVNCPFDSIYQPLFHAIVFVIIRSGFRPRCALEADDGSENRFDKICKIIGECRYGVHDISRTELDDKTKLLRFNMPLELGLFLGAKKLGGKSHSQKQCIIFDRFAYRFQTYISDIAGHDIHSHRGNKKTLIVELATWLRQHSRDAVIPGGKRISDEFHQFMRRLPQYCTARRLDLHELSFGDYASIVEAHVLELA